jgi:penicillin-binding protein 1A
LIGNDDRAYQSFFGDERLRFGKQMKNSQNKARRIIDKGVKYLATLLHPAVLKWNKYSAKKPRRSRLIKWVAFTFLIMLLSLNIFLLIISFSVPTARQLRRLQAQAASEIYSSDSVLIGRYYDQYRILVPYDSMPKYLIDALVATEDERFFEHDGIDYRAWGRVLFRSILKGDRSGGGGSTISQQLAKNMLLRADYPVFSLPINKSREIIAARRLERVYKKEKILELYLNTVTFPDNMFGIDVASRRFFSKKSSQITMEEAALLIGTLKGTSLYHPLRNPERAEQRRNIVFRQMLKNQYISNSDFDSLASIPLALNYSEEVRNEGLAPHFREFVRGEVQQLLAEMPQEAGEDPYDLYTDGLKIYTTLHAGLQREAENAVRKHLTEVQNKFDQHWQGFTAPWYDVATVDMAVKNSLYYQYLKGQDLDEEQIKAKFEEKDSVTIFTWEGTEEVYMSPLDVIKYHLGILQVGLMSIEPTTGYIRAWVGGTEFDFSQYDHVRARRQSGSVFKPIVYTQALINGIDPCVQIANNLLVYHEYAKHEWDIKDYRRDDPEPHFDPDGTDLDDWVPQNADGKYGGSYSMLGAITNSVNTATVHLILQTGVDSVIHLARKMGITGEIPQEPSIALGSASMSVYDLTKAYATLANRGRKVSPVVVMRIESHDGEMLADFRSQNYEQVIDTSIADLMTHMLESVATSGTASRLRWRYGLYGHPIAGKTGTSQNHADGWFIGYNPDLVTGVWVGGDSPLVRFRNFQNGQGAATALPIWAYYMKEVLDNPEFEDWQKGEFPPLTPEQEQLLACPMRIKSQEEIYADSLAQDSITRMIVDTLSIETIPPVN